MAGADMPTPVAALSGTGGWDYQHGWSVSDRAAERAMSEGESLDRMPRSVGQDDVR